MDDNTRAIVAANLAAGIIATSHTPVGHTEDDAQRAIWVFEAVLRKLESQAKPPRQA